MTGYLDRVRPAANLILINVDEGQSQPNLGERIEV